MKRAVLRAARSTVRSVAAAVLPAAALILAAGPAGATAHGETFFQLGADRVQPGAQVEVRADLGGGDAFRVALIASADGSRRDLGTIPATEEGHVQTYLTIPSDVPTGDYLVEIAWDVTLVRAPLTVAGPPITDAEGERPDQDEGFAGPATGAPMGPAMAASSRVAVASESPSAGVDRGGPVEALGIVVAAGLAAMGVLGALRLAGGRSRGSRPGG